MTTPGHEAPPGRHAIRAGIAAFAVSQVLAAGEAHGTGAKLPPLRPPWGPLPPTFWEEWGYSLSIGAVFAGILVAAVWLKAKRRRELHPVPPVVEARAALRKLHGRLEDKRLLGEVAAIVRHYFQGAFKLPEGSTTDREMIQMLLGSGEVGPRVAALAAEFLQHCEHVRFSPMPDLKPEGAVERAEALIEAAEGRRRELARG